MSVLTWILLGVGVVSLSWILLWLFIWFAPFSDDEDENADLDPNVPPLVLPPFGELRWSKYEWWEGQARSTGWIGFCSAYGPYNGDLEPEVPSNGDVDLIVAPPDPKHDRTPSEAQRSAFRFQIERGAEVAKAILAALPRYYEEQRETWGLRPREMPDHKDPEDFRHLIGLNSMTIHPFLKDGMAYVGLEFACEWDPEHGFGVMVHGSQIVGMGDWDAASEDARPDDAKDPEATPKGV